MIVAHAAPATPISKTKIKIGSRMVLMIAPISIHIMEYFGLPSALARLLIQFTIIRNGIPMAVILV